MDAKQELHPLISLLSATFSVLFWLLTWVKTTIAFLLVFVPRWIYAILSYSFTLTLNFYALAFLFCAGCVGLSFLIRFRYLSTYKNLRELPLGKPSALELHPDVNKAEEPAAFHNYLDEFLQAVRIFGFLEKPVFHELARHLQTRRLIAGDTMSLDADKSFYCVVDGNVQVFAPPSKGSDLDDGWEEGDMNGYQLLNDVGSGGTLSSLFTILSLFTENIQLRWSDSGTPATNVTLSPSSSQSGSFRKRERVDSDVSQLELEGHAATEKPHGSSMRRKASVVSSVSSASTVHVSPDAPRLSTRVRSNSDAAEPDWDPTWSPPSESSPGTPNYRSLRNASDYFGATQSRPQTQRAHTSNAPLQQGIIARATTDTTLAVIPAEAFRRLTQKFPKASAHIVQVILTRFSRVTFQSAHKYLGLTSELLRTEKAINDIACHPLPRSFYEGGGIESLRQRFQHTGSVSGEGEASEDESDYFNQSDESRSRQSLANGSRRGGKPRRTTIGRTLTGATSLSNASTATIAGGPLRLSTTTTSAAAAAPPPSEVTARPASVSSDNQRITKKNSPISTSKSPITPFKPSVSRTAVHAGDLLTSAGRMQDPLHSHRNTLYSTPHFGRRLSGSSSSLMREAGRMQVEDFDLREEVMSCIAKSIGLQQPPLSGTDSTQESPMPFETRSESTPSKGNAMFNSSFSSLLQGDDAASSLSSSVLSGDPSGNYMTGLDNEVEILSFPAGSLIVKAGEKNAGLFYVIDGLLDVSIPVDKEEPNHPVAGEPRAKSPQHSTQKRQQSHLPGNGFADTKTMKHLFTVKPGGIAGYFASLSSIPSYVDIRAKTDVYVGLLPANALERLLEKKPIVLLTLAKRLISLLSPLVLHVDSSMDWAQLNSGQVLWRPGDASDSFYIVLNGRLRAITEREDGEVVIVAEYGQGDTVGELDAITNQARRTTLHAIRDTELARMPMTLFNAISARHPRTTVQLLRMIATRVRDEVGTAVNTSRLPTTGIASGLQPLSGRGNLNLKTVAIVPAHKNVPVEAFARKLQGALEEIGAPTSFLNQGAVMRHLGKHAFSRIGKLKVAGWLADLEQRYRIVLYVANSPVGSPWTQTCIRQADSIMVVGFGDEPSLGDYERLLMSSKTTARKELVLLHPTRYVTPGTTRKWLKERPWIHAHFHVELPGIEVQKTVPILEDPAAVAAFKMVKERVQSELQKYRGGASIPRPRRLPQMSDFARLARHLCGRSIGLVLGGGGARGLSHVGMIQAMEEMGIPIDHIGGTSIGALIGGLYAEEGDIISCAARAKQFSMRMGSFWRLATDLTWPIVAYTTGHEFNRSLYKCFYDSHIEDMWLPFFCNSTNILDSRQELHDSGYAWRYIRASMTLVGMLPPLSDNGRVLVDGGYVDNLPVAAMQGYGTTSVFAIDVGSLDDNTPRHFGDTVSGSWMMLNRWNPFSSARSVPQIAEIQTRLAYVSSIRNLEEAKVAPNCLYVALPVQEFGTLQFGRFDDIKNVGYKSGLETIAKWDAQGLLPSGFEEGVGRSKPRGRERRRNSI
ncbi:Lysophospholipase NTE1; AltName: Full=Intracellular phospholipase B; AltName: Full=Neuropathy target esterase homolog [Serendipita indica DSM 11827]|uniref:Lysophospholipase NTE1 n=1 Tax=Serendipita indica (strain DSM 11827) TaxID=1109443 RepID=G4TEQ3_SERID|nr:Lysophospholipase NTE1; AltName: Full=Intracellular phospholipase B; AltName: Full=Neuropathy target esterase homolog [Serendipita indica DSM 11827]CCA69800.1 related to NTE1-Serine esterase [Serendipita indica DSM 11827]